MREIGHDSHKYPVMDEPRPPGVARRGAAMGWGSVGRVRCSGDSEGRAAPDDIAVRCHTGGASTGVPLYIIEQNKTLVVSGVFLAASFPATSARCG